MVKDTMSITSQSEGRCGVIAKHYITRGEDVVRNTLHCKYMCFFSADHWDEMRGERFGNLRVPDCSIFCNHWHSLRGRPPAAHLGVNDCVYSEKPAK